MQGMSRILTYCLIVFILTGCVSTSLVQSLMDDVEKLKKDNNALKKQVKELDAELSETQQEIAALKENAVSEVDTAEPSPTPTVTPTSIPTPAVMNDEEWYGKGQDLFHQDKYREAARAFEKAAMLSRSPEMSARCYYWLGECFYSQGAYDRALSFFYRVTDEYETQSKAPDALLKIGFTYTEMKDYNRAVKVLKDYLDKYPTHRAVPLAEEKLRWIEQVRSGGGTVDSTAE